MKYAKRMMPARGLVKGTGLPENWKSCFSPAKVADRQMLAATRAHRGFARIRDIAARPSLQLSVSAIYNGAILRLATRRGSSLRDPARFLCNTLFLFLSRFLETGANRSMQRRYPVAHSTRRDLWLSIMHKPTAGVAIFLHSRGFAKKSLHCV